MHQISKEKKSDLLDSRRRFDVVETSPNAAEKSIFLQNLTLNSKKTSILPIDCGKGPNFDDFANWVWIRAQTYIYVIWYAKG